jgi:chromosome partitioning protein
MIIAVLNPKGGSGKTTLCTNLARSLQKRGNNVLIVDSDEQGTSADWLSMQDETSDQPGVVNVTNPATMQRDLKNVAAAYDFVCVDGAAKMIATLQNATIAASDLVLIPCRPSAADIWSSASIVETIKARQELTAGKQPKAAFVINAQIAGTYHAAEIDDALQAYGLPILKGRLTQRVSYAEAIAQGCTVLDLQNATKATEEINDITNEILENYG